ncbi:MAG: SPOR domain-containing protein [Proteobacteria bacterium]|nr:SPOR domain-containing protein [Pseudomonadota bacterium]
MEPALKNRLIGAAVLSALAIIFLPKLIVGKDNNPLASQVPLKVPTAPGGAFETKELPLVTPAPSVPAGGVVGMQTGHPASPAASTASSTASSAASPAASSAASNSPQPATTSNAASPSSSASASTAAVTSPVASGKTPTTAVVASVASPAVPTAPAPIPAAQAGGKYVVSLGTYANAGNAHALVASLQAKGLPAYADAVNVAGRPATRVRIGPFQQRGDAEAARLKAQQVRTDMPANVMALDAASPAPPEPAAASPKTTASSAAASNKNIASTATDKPASLSPAAAARGYAVQVSAFALETQANALRDKLRGAGFVAYSEKVTTESGVRWRVRAGPEADRAAADKLRADLAVKMKLDGMVVAYP